MLSVMSPRLHHFDAFSPLHAAHPFPNLSGDEDDDLDLAFQRGTAPSEIGDMNFPLQRRTMVASEVPDLDFPFSGSRMASMDVPFYNLRASYAPPILQQKDNSYVFTIETPGIKKQDLSVELLGRRTLVVSASDPSQNTDASDASASDQPQPQPRPRSQPSRASRFCRLPRSIDLPPDADWASTKLTYADGLLTVEVAKKAGPGAGDGEMASALATEVKGKIERMEELRKEIAATQQALMQAQRDLMKARQDEMRAAVKERRTMVIDGPSENEVREDEAKEEAADDAGERKEDEVKEDEVKEETADDAGAETASELTEAVGAQV